MGRRLDGYGSAEVGRGERAEFGAGKAALLSVSERCTNAILSQSEYNSRISVLTGTEYAIRSAHSVESIFIPLNILQHAFLDHRMTHHFTCIDIGMCLISMRRVLNSSISSNT